MNSTAIQNIGLKVEPSPLVSRYLGHHEQSLWRSGEAGMKVYPSTHASSFWMATGLATSAAAAMADITPVWVSPRVSQESSYASGSRRYVPLTSYECLPSESRYEKIEQMAGFPAVLLPFDGVETRNVDLDGESKLDLRYGRWDVRDTGAPLYRSRPTGPKGVSTRS
jgi:hypothetical protein